MPSAPIIPSDQAVPEIGEILRGYDDGEPLRLTRRPGERWAYSGGGYLLMQAVLEDIKGVDFADYADAVLFEPLGMRDASFRPEGMSRDGAAVGHEDGAPLTPYHLPGPAGGLYASVRDFARFMALYAPSRGSLRRDLVSKEAFTRMTEPVAQVWLDDALIAGAFYGLGHGVHTASSGERFVYHSGGNPGVAAYFIVSLASGNGIAIVSTGDDRVSMISDVLSIWAETYDVELPALY